MSDSDSDDDLLLDQSHKAPTIASPTTKETVKSPDQITSPLAADKEEEGIEEEEKDPLAWIESHCSQEKEDELVRELSAAIANKSIPKDESPKKKSPKKKVIKKTKRIKCLDTDSEEEIVENVFSKYDIAVGPSNEDNEQWNKESHSNAVDFVWVKANFIPSAIKNEPKQVDNKKDDVKEEKKKVIKKTKKEILAEELVLKKQAEKEAAQIKANKKQWWPARKISNFREREWLRQEHFISKDFDFDTNYLLMFFDDKNSLYKCSIHSKDIKPFNKPNSKSSKSSKLDVIQPPPQKKSKKLIKIKDLQIWNPDMIKSLSDDRIGFNKEKYLMTLKTSEKLRIKAKLWLKTALYGLEVRNVELGDYVIDDKKKHGNDDDDDEEDEEIARQRHHKMVSEMSEHRINEDELKPETLRAGDSIEFHDPRIKLHAGSKCHATITEVKKGGLKSQNKDDEGHIHPLLLSNSLGCVIHKDFLLRKIDTLTKGENVEGAVWRRLETYQLIEGAGTADMKLESDQTAIAKRMKVANEEVNQSIIEQHNKLFNCDASDMKDEDDDGDDEEDDDDDDDDDIFCDDDKEEDRFEAEFS